LRRQFWGPDDEKFRNDQRGANIKEDNLRMYERRGKNVLHALRKGNGEHHENSSQQRVQVPLTLQSLDIDDSLPQAFPQQDDGKCNRLQKQALPDGMTRVASLPAFGSAAQRSPARALQPLPSGPCHALQVRKGSLKYASS